MVLLLDILLSRVPFYIVTSTMVTMRSLTIPRVWQLKLFSPCAKSCFVIAPLQLTIGLVAWCVRSERRRVYIIRLVG